jgi:hypothetical protein
MDTNIENQKQSILKPAMNYGLIIGVFLVAFSVIQWSLNLMMNKSMSWSIYLLMIVCLYIFAKKYRDDHLGGYISYGKALGFSVLTLAFASFIFGFYNFILYKFIDPGLADMIFEKSREQMLENNTELSEEQIDTALSFSRKFMTPAALFIGTMLSTVFFGFIISLITSIFVMKKDKSFDNSSFQPPL